MHITRRGAIGALAGSTLVLDAAAAPVPTRPAPSMPEMPVGPGWEPLFNGRDLTGWTFFEDGVGSSDRNNAVDIHGGELHLLGPGFKDVGSGGFGYLATDREYGDYHLYLEYKWGTRRYGPRKLWKRDSGVLYHAADGPEHLWPDCVEYQIMEKNTGDALPVNYRAIAAISLGGLPSWPQNPPGITQYAPQVNTGDSLRQWIRAEGDFELPMEWNSLQLIAKGSDAAHLVNDRIVNAVYSLQAPVAGDRTRYAPIQRGRILLQMEASEIMFRNIRIKPI